MAVDLCFKSQASEVWPEVYLSICMHDSYHSPNIFVGGARVGTIHSSFFVCDNYVP
jgi:hypothetical protein